MVKILGGQVWLWKVNLNQYGNNIIIIIRINRQRSAHHINEQNLRRPFQDSMFYLSFDSRVHDFFNNHNFQESEKQRKT